MVNKPKPYLIQDDDIIKVPRFEEESGFYATAKSSAVMSKIRSKNTKPEIMLRKALWAHGCRYRLHAKGIKVLGRFDVSKLNETLAVKKPEWLYIGTDGKNVNYNGQVHTCVNGGYQQQYSFEILHEVIGRTNRPNHCQNHDFLSLMRHI